MDQSQSQSPSPSRPVPADERPRGPIGLPWLLVIGLGLLGAPRVVLHDLGLLGEGFGILSLVLTVAPMAVWVWVLVSRRVTPLIATAVAIGGVYGVALAAIHQLLWDEAFGDDPPSFGGNLDGKLGESAEEAVFRLASIPSSIAVGVVLGLVAGLVARALVARREP